MKKYISILFILVATNGFAAERYEFYTGARQLAMGGASVAVVNDETAIILNPAGLGKLRNLFVTIFDPEIHGSTKNASTLQSQNLNNLTTFVGLKDILVNKRDNHLHLKFQAFPSVAISNFGFGILGKYSYDAEVSTTTTNTNNLRLDYTNDIAAILAYNFRFFDGRVKIGFNAKLINRVEIHQDIDLDTQSDATLTAAALGNQGAGLSLDAGLILSAPIKWLPSLGVVARDVGDTQFTAANGLLTSSSSNRPDPVKQTMDVGIAVFPIVGRNTRVAFTIEYQDVLTAKDETDHTRRSHTGLEFNFSDIFFIRAGMNQRYFSSGFEFATDKVQLQVTSYGEEIGTAAAPREDKRVVGKFAFRF